MGYAVARAARDAGAEVTLVSGPPRCAPRGVHRIDVSSALEMHDAVMARVAEADIFVGAPHGGRAVRAGSPKRGGPRHRQRP